MNPANFLTEQPMSDEQTSKKLYGYEKELSQMRKAEKRHGISTKMNGCDRKGKLRRIMSKIRENELLDGEE